PDNPRAVVDAVTQAAKAAVAPKDTPVAVNAAAVEVFNAVTEAAKDAKKTARDLADSAKAASDNVAAQAPAIKSHLADLQTEDVRTLFVFQNGFLADRSDRELAAFRSEFINNYTAGSGFAKIKGELGDALFDRIDKFIEKDLSNFTSLRLISLDAIDRIRRAPQLSVAYFTKQRKEGVNEHTGEVVFDWGIANKMNLTANGAFEYRDSNVVGGDTR